MSPQLFDRQAKAGAWAITVGTVHQIQVARHFGSPRIVLANQLVGKQGMRYVTDELARDPQFEFFCLVDSVAGVEALAAAAKAKNLRGRIGVFLEGGLKGGRTGARTIEEARAVAKAAKAAHPYVSLRGVEGFEGASVGRRCGTARHALPRFPRRHRQNGRCRGPLRGRAADPDGWRLGLLRSGRREVPRPQPEAAQIDPDALGLLHHARFGDVRGAFRRHRRTLQDACRTRPAGTGAGGLGLCAVAAPSRRACW